MSMEYVEKFYNAFSPYYDVLFGKISHGGRERVPQLLNLTEGTRLLEVGVGTGLTLPLLPRTIDITGIDMSDMMLSKARERATELRMDHVTLHKMDATAQDFPDNHFDCVLAAYIVSVVPDANKLVAEMRRVCKPGGQILFLNHFRSDNLIIGGIEKLISPFCFRIGFNTDLRLRDLMRDNGLTIEHMEPVDFLGNWKAVRCINPPK